MTAASTAARLPRTQTEQVLDHLRNQGPLTQLEAQEQIGCLRLGARIWDLKQRGHAIKTEFVELASGQRVARYMLVREAQRQPASGEVGGTAEQPRTLDDVLLAFGELASARGAPPSEPELRAALGVASEAAMLRWLRVLEREGYLATIQSAGRNARRWRLAPSGSDRLYALERRRRIEAEERSEASRGLEPGDLGESPGDIDEGAVA